MTLSAIFKVVVMVISNIKFPAVSKSVISSTKLPTTLKLMTKVNSSVKYSALSRSVIKK